MGELKLQKPGTEFFADTSVWLTLLKDLHHVQGYRERWKIGRSMIEIES